MRRWICVLGLFASGCGALPPANATDAGTAYALDPAASALYVQVFKDTSTVGSDLAHDHVILATGWTGTVRLDAANPALCEARIVVPVSGLQPDPPDLRQKVGYSVMLTDDQRAQVGEHMRGADQLNATAFPEIRFESTTCTGTGEARVLNGTFSVRGVSKAVKIPLKITNTTDGVKAVGIFTLKHADFGFEPYTAMLGALRNKDELRFTINVVGTRQ